MTAKPLLPAFTGPPAPNRVYHCDALTLLGAMDDNSVQCCITSPPYFGLRDYGVDGQLGLEDTPQAYVARLTAVFREVRRVLRKDGTLWVNLGDSYATSPKGNPGNGLNGARFGEREITYNKGRSLSYKNLFGIPWRVAFALQDDGWILRSDIIWHKPNPMPESVIDRPTKAHEYVFLLAKQPRYYYDAEAIAEPVKAESLARQMRGVSDCHKNVNGAPGQTPHSMNQPRSNVRKQDALGKRTYTGEIHTRNKRTVWTVATQSFSGAHFATFPPNLIEPMIRAGCPPGGLVLDPFFGTGTTGYVAQRLNRRYIGCDISFDYCEMARRRLAEPYTLPMFERSLINE